MSMDLKKSILLESKNLNTLYTLQCAYCCNLNSIRLGFVSLANNMKGESLFTIFYFIYSFKVKGHDKYPNAKQCLFLHLFFFLLLKKTNNCIVLGSFLVLHNRRTVQYYTFTSVPQFSFTVYIKNGSLLSGEELCEIKVFGADSHRPVLTHNHKDKPTPDTPIAFHSSIFSHVSLCPL